ncbi:unnamed protein product, partial [Effrenium voratum]
FPKPLGAWRAGSLFLVALSLTVHLYQCRKKSPAPLAASSAQAKYVRNVSATSDEASTEASVQVAETASEKDEASMESSEEGASSSLPQLRSFGHDEVKDFEDPSVGSVQVMKYASEKDEANDSDTSTTCSARRCNQGPIGAGRCNRGQCNRGPIGARLLRPYTTVSSKTRRCQLCTVDGAQLSRA